MIGYIANGFGAARTNAGIDAFVIDARPRRTAFGVQRAFGTTTDVRIAHVLLDARADGIIAFGIRTAWRWFTRIVRWRRFVAFDDLHALGEWVAGEMWSARTARDMVLDATFCEFSSMIKIGISFNFRFQFLNLNLPELKPQEPSHGFLHRSAMHALSDAQSEFTTHSGRQLGGEPK